MQKKWIGIACGAMLTVAGVTHAEQGHVDVGAKIGTLGIGGEAGIGLLDNVNLRAGVNYLKFSFDTTISNIDYDMEPEFKNISLLLDWYPFSGAFKLTGGLLINNNEIHVKGKPRYESILGDYVIPPEYESLAASLRPLAESVNVTGSVEFNPVAPYIGLGWNSNVEREPGWGVSFELGVMFQGEPEVSTLTASADPPLGYLANHPTVVAALEEEKKAIEDEVENYQYYPVATFMINYTF